MQDVRDLSLMLDSRVPLIVIETFEEKRVLDMLMRVANKRGKNIYRWSCTEGLSRQSFGPSLALTSDQQDPLAVLQQIKDMSEAGIFVLCDFHPYFEAPHSENAPLLTRLIKDLVINHYSVPHTLVFLSYKFSLPTELTRYSALFQLSLPSDERIMAIVREEAKQWSDKNGGVRVKTDNITLDKMVANLQGLPESDVRRLVRGAIVDDGAITDDDLPEINQVKFALMDMQGVMSFEFHTEAFDSVGGLDNLKDWLKKRRDAFLSPSEFSDKSRSENARAEVSGSKSGPRLDSPKGIMLLGVQGAGKSLAAKAVSRLWGVPLLRLDFGALYNKFFGETERNLREALKLADTMSPCVLWLDEIEKGMGHDGAESGTSKRVLGTLLTWMAERKSQVFLVCTSNDIAGLPPELVRKGRLDEIFFVDLPEAEARHTIFKIHLNKRSVSIKNFNLAPLVAASEGFSGAEIEQAIVAAIYTAAALDDALSDKHVLNELQHTRPLSVVMAEKIAKLRSWAASRTVSAN